MHLHLVVKSGSQTPFAAQRFFWQGEGGTWWISRYVKRITYHLSTIYYYHSQPSLWYLMFIVYSPNSFGNSGFPSSSKITFLLKYKFDKEMFCSALQH
jgi:hypothetical protein